MACLMYCITIEYPLTICQQCCFFFFFFVTNTILSAQVSSGQLTISHLISEQPYRLELVQTIN